MIDEPPTQIEEEDEEEVQTPLDETVQAEAEPEAMAPEAMPEAMHVPQGAQEATQATTDQTALEPQPRATQAEDEQLPDQPSDKTLDNISVRVDFRVGEITMPVNELASLAPGFTLTDLPGLTFPRAQAISAGRVFAEGELVDIEGKIGFRITRLLP